MVRLDSPVLWKWLHLVYFSTSMAQTPYGRWLHAGLVRIIENIPSDVKSTGREFNGLCQGHVLMYNI